MCGDRNTHRARRFANPPDACAWRDASGEFYGVIAADRFEDSDCGDSVILDVEGGLRGDGQVGMWIRGIQSANVERIKDDDFSDAALAASKVIDLQIYRWAKWFTNLPPDERRHAFFRARLAGRSATEAYNRPLQPAPGWRKRQHPRHRASLPRLRARPWHHPSATSLSMVAEGSSASTRKTADARATRAGASFAATSAFSAIWGTDHEKGVKWFAKKANGAGLTEADRQERKKQADAAATSIRTGKRRQHKKVAKAPTS